MTNTSSQLGGKIVQKTNTIGTVYDLTPEQAERIKFHREVRANSKRLRELAKELTLTKKEKNDE